jgi:hypothetical protein
MGRPYDALLADTLATQVFSGEIKRKFDF